MASFENSVVVAKNVNFDLAGAKPHLGVLNAGGKLPIGTGNTYPTPEILAGNLVSPDGSITVGYSSPNITLQTTQSSQFVIRGPNVDFVTVGNTILFTPIQKFVLVGYVVITMSVTGTPNLDSTSKMGWTAPNYDDITDGIPGAAIPTELDFQAGNFIPTQINNFQVIPAGNSIVWRVSSIDTGATVYTNRVDLIGYYF